jgi:hypothetical protein
LQQNHAYRLELKGKSMRDPAARRATPGTDENGIDEKIE